MNGPGTKGLGIKAVKWRKLVKSKLPIFLCFLILFPLPISMISYRLFIAITIISVTNSATLEVVAPEKPYSEGISKKA